MEIIGPLIDCIGDTQFGPKFAGLFHKQFQMDHFHMFQIFPTGPLVLESASYDGTGRAKAHAEIYTSRKIWRFDKTMVNATGFSSTQPAVFHEDVNTFADLALKQFRKQADLGARTVVIGEGSKSVIGFSLAWSKKLHPRSVELDSSLDLAFAVMKKHLEVVEYTDHLCDSVSSLREIEANLSRLIAGRRPRGMQVAARLLLGRTATQIARELNLSAETVITHRKRLYDFLGVQNQRDLLLWYLRSARLH